MTSNTSSFLRSPKGFLLHIGIFGRRNVGKSSLVNALTRQETSIVSDIPGTTTDPVEKPMELLGIGPVLLVDTAGIDDVDELGQQRVRKTWNTLDRIDVALVVSSEVESDGCITQFEESLFAELNRRKIPFLFIINKSDLALITPSTKNRLEASTISYLLFSAKGGIVTKNMADLRSAILKILPEDAITPPIVSDLLPPNGVVVLVIPIDKAAPKGRLILPQVQTIRELLDNHQTAFVVQDISFRKSLARLVSPPDLVITDSQAFGRIAAETPDSVPLTSFSILFARQKGDITTMVRGARQIGALRPGSKVLIAESCTHHPVEEDI
ncbi:MAG: [FeFe] hydrogenase H-cluster maturation GTPase HydF, partial [Thermoguttaceae bacterium]